MSRSRLLAVVSLVALCHADNAKMQTTQTAFDAQNPDLLKSMPAVDMKRVDTPTSNALVVDRSVKYQEMLGFGGAFTEAAAVNWMKLSPEDKDKVMHLYFADPADGGHGYTMGRVPMGSCDFTVSSYSFNNVSDDMDMQYFDNSVAHDESSGMLPMMRAAKALVDKRQNQTLNIFASPWSPPAWMKYAQGTDFKMTGSALPVGFNMKYGDAYSKYFSKFITAYKNKGIDIWGVTPQNEPEFAAAWEGCVFTPEYEAEFVGNHLGPILKKDFPDIKIIGYDHNKDHVVDWANGLYKNDSAKQYFDGIGVHWYGGLNTQNLNTTHHIAPDKFILATEACNCGGVTFKNETKDWWSRAEKLAIDILEDIKWWSAGWIDWNLVLNTRGGPNHLGNLCDANIIADPDKTLGGDTLIMQASYYYMGHFSRFIPAGSRQIGLNNSVKVVQKVTPEDLIGRKLQFLTCDNSDAQTWQYNKTDNTLRMDGLCVQQNTSEEPAVMANCTQGDASQQWTINGGQITSKLNGKCLSSVQTGGQAIGLDPGVDVDGGLVEQCVSGPSPDIHAPLQNFTFENAGSKSFPDAFHLKTSKGTCMLPAGFDNVLFEAAAFETPSGQISLVVMNLGKSSVSFDVHDKGPQMSATVTLPAHAIATYTWGATETFSIFV